MKKTLYSSKFIKLQEEHVKINGSDAKVLSLVERDVVVVLPLLRGDKILIERQYRPVLKKYIYELPAGHIDPGESPREAAERELREETGFFAGNLRHMYSVYPTPGLSAQISNYFLATDLHKDGKKLDKDPDEVIETKEIGLNNLIKMIREGKIKDNKTISGVLYYLYLFRK
ncbi:MAG: NUDIX hydrolase [Candidatus Micrarchaeales archaeon]|jgi:ADP-ribose pyrophosphatase|uniref:NUDIX hydrolase n=1 Tax=Candidatus Micrarchaeum acidiphilum ARMAN-2 TaxID=425595 RepID=C7DI82_MICA2|nr:MAG: NUDIX hydrolase [Candidatus Micrarchaeum acidiphilum ARMAN-2]MCW6160907.1 NUDIX hydrolase [Candidatus Micrarchaeales archaeon]